jgi:hypothetical protein
MSYTWTYDHRIKWDEATIKAIDSHKFSRKMRESIEIVKHNTIDQDGKPLDSTWRAKLIFPVLDTRALIRIT